MHTKETISEALSSEHTLWISAKFSGVVDMDSLCAGNTIISPDLETETFDLSWEGMDAVVTDDGIKDFVITEKIFSKRHAEFEDSLGVVVSESIPSWFRHFVLMEGIEPEVSGEGKKMSIHDRKAMLTHFQNALELVRPTRLTKEFEGGGCPVPELAPRIPLANLSTALNMFAENLQDEIKGCAVITSARIHTSPAFAWS